MMMNERLPWVVPSDAPSHDLAAMVALAVAPHVGVQQQGHEDNDLLFGVNDRRTPAVAAFLRAWDAPDSPLPGAYQDFLVRSVLPSLGELDPRQLMVQRTPNLRVQECGSTGIGRRPGIDRDGAVGIHTDGEFGHPAGELNCVLAVSPMRDTASVFYEPAPGAPLDAFASIELEPGETWCGNLNVRRHYNRANVEGFRRLSLDFRVVLRHELRDVDAVSATSRRTFAADGTYYRPLLPPPQA